MANPEVSRLIQELSTILNQNREKRNAADAMMMGMQQGFQAAQARKQQQGAAAGKAAGQGASDAAAAASYADTKSGYGGDPVSPYRISKDGAGRSRDTQAGAAGGSREGRLGLASKYIEAQGGSSPREAELLSKNPYTGSGYEFLPENDSPPSMTPDPALEEQKKRFTQNLMLSRGQAGGPMGGAGQPPTSDGLDPAVVNAVSRGGGPIGQMGTPMPNMGGQQAPQPMPNAGPPAGFSQQDYDLLTALSQRYPGG